MFIILVPALTLIMYLTINKGLMPLQQLATQINRRSENNLTPLKNDDRHSEIITIKNSLNELLNKLHDILAREKRITSDAAHELRTPLAAIRLHTELAKNAKTEREKTDSLEQVIQGVDRTTHLVEQLLTLARLEPDSLANDFSQVDLAALIIEECALLSPLALDKNIDISFDDQSAHNINGHEASLRLLIRNLLNNAINYTQHDGKVDISLSTQDKHTVLTVEDNGPGLSENELKRVTERFYRGKNQQTPGCGIGLSIVDQVVQIHNGTMQLCQADSGRGLKVIIRL
jgi:signal transduction histidine kinase